MQQPIDASVDPFVASAKTLFDRLFVPVDYTMDSHRAVGAALALQQTLGSSVCLFHATQSDITDEWLGGIGSPAVLSDPVMNAEQRLRRFVENVAIDTTPQIETRARIGDTIRLVREEARVWGATLIIVSAEVRARLFRSTAEKLIHSFDVPMLVIPTTAPH